jgi:prolyl oligopeptidase
VSVSVLSRAFHRAALRAAVFAGSTALSVAVLAQTPAPAVATPPPPPPAGADVDDPYLWLEEVMGERALNFVREANALSTKELTARPEFASIEKRLLEILNDRSRIPAAAMMNGQLYNFWRDGTNPRGLWRRTTLAEYAKPQPAWETVIDLDAVAREEKENWVWSGTVCLPPADRRCLIQLSRGGADATVVREFDTVSKTWVKDGFTLKEAKHPGGSLAWRDENTLYVGTDTGPGSMNESGYPRQIRLWKRGTALAAAPVVFEGKATDVFTRVQVDHTQGFKRTLFGNAPGFFSGEWFIERGGAPRKLDFPIDAIPVLWREWLTLRLRSDWKVGGKTYPQGSLLATRLAAFERGERRFDVLFTPTPLTSAPNVTRTRNALVLTYNENVVTQAVELQRKGAQWVRREMKLPGLGAATVAALDADRSDELWVSYTDFLTPPSLYLTRVGQNPTTPIKANPAFWDASKAMVEQFQAASKDGTRVPYFVVRSKDAKLDGKNPTIISAYGGFEISRTPAYSGNVGTAWIERGGVFIVANIRGGGEFGPRWHQAALKANRQKAFDDLIAVAEDAIARRITAPRHLGIQGGSNGGLLVGAVAVQRPDLFNAVVCQVPLLDMLRYDKLLAGASWVAEYGDPDLPAERAFLAAYSPYQNVKPGVKYPRILFTTSTRDDRVHPGHARKMFARMQAQGHDVLYYENIEGGHAGAANSAQRARMSAMEFTFMLNQLR